MTTEISQEDGAQSQEGAGEGEQITGESGDAEIVSISKTDYDKLNQTLGSLKRELKDLKKSKEETPKETPKQTKPDEIGLLKERLEKQAIRAAGLTHPDDIDLARKTAKKWNLDIDDVLTDDDFKVKLERQQTARANIEASSNVKGATGQSQMKDSPEYWIAKGIPPSAKDVPDRKARAKIARAMMANAKSSKTFYND